MSDRAVFLNDQTYTDGQEDPLEALRTTLAFSVDDWAASRAMAWVWGIVLGWDDESMAELAQDHGWNDATTARLNRLHERFAALATDGAETEPSWAGLLRAFHDIKTMEGSDGHSWVRRDSVSALIQGLPDPATDGAET